MVYFLYPDFHLSDSLHRTYTLNYVLYVLYECIKKQENNVRYIIIISFSFKTQGTARKYGMQTLGLSENIIKFCYCDVVLIN